MAPHPLISKYKNILKTNLSLIVCIQETIFLKQGRDMYNDESWWVGTHWVGVYANGDNLFWQLRSYIHSKRF